MAGCDGAREAAPSADVGPDAAAVDAGAPCTEPADCDDGDDCTIDTCVAEACAWSRAPLRVVAAPGVPIDETVRDVALAGDDLFIAKGADGLEAWDLSATPATLRWARGPEGDEVGFFQVTVGDGLVYVVDGERDVLALDRQSSAPRGRARALDPVRDILGRGDLVYAAVGAKGIEVFRFEDPDAPRRVGRADTPGRASGLGRRGDRLLVADGLAGLTVMAVDDPAAPTRLGDAIATSGRITAAAADGPLGLVAEGEVGLGVVELGPAPRRRASLPLEAAVTDVAMLGRRTGLVAAGSAGLRVVDLIDPASPSAEETIAPTVEGVVSVQLADGRAAVRGAREVVVLDVSCPAAE